VRFSHFCACREDAESPASCVQDSDVSDFISLAGVVNIMGNCVPEVCSADILKSNPCAASSECLEALKDDVATNTECWSMPTSIMSSVSTKKDFLTYLGL
jgi:hypothetical protein